MSKALTPMTTGPEAWYWMWYEVRLLRSLRLVSQRVTDAGTGGEVGRAREGMGAGGETTVWLPTTPAMMVSSRAPP